LLVNPFDETDDVVASVIDAIDHTVGTVFLVSPDNPSGRVLSAQHLDSLSRACAVVDAVLVVDQCFALIDPFEFGVPMATNLGCRWCVLWDSSKTTELSGERVGVVLPGGDVGERVQASLNVVELEVPMTSVVAVRRMLEQLIGTVGLEMMNRAVADNYTLLKEACASAGIRVNRPDAGSFALVDLTETRFAEVPATCAEALLDRAGIAVAHSALFVPPGTRCSGFLRVSLARPTAAVELLCEKLAEHLR
jgi:aspartate/methionine/tyrosine aminotransferase